MNQFNGIVLSKTLVKEQDLIVNMLHENGAKVSLYIYGGKSSKTRKSSIVEYGHVLTVKTQEKKNRSSELNIAKEYQLKWSGNNIRDNFKAFYLMSFYLEIINATVVESEDYEDDSHRDFYNLLANAIYYLDKDLDKNFNSFNHLFIFMTKLIYYLGIMPDLSHCMASGSDLREFENIYLDIGQGGFVGQAGERENDSLMLSYLKQVYQTPYKEVHELNIDNREYSRRLFEYFCVNMDLNIEKFKLYQMVLN